MEGIRVIIQLERERETKDHYINFIDANEGVKVLACLLINALEAKHLSDELGISINEFPF